jgi:hypothetical protein
MLTREGTSTDAKKRLLRTVANRVERLTLRTKVGHFWLVAIGLLIVAYVGARFGFPSSLILAFILLIVSEPLSFTGRSLKSYSAAIDEALRGLDARDALLSDVEARRWKQGQRVIVYLRDFEGDVIREAQRHPTSERVVTAWLSSLDAEIILFSNLLGESGITGRNVTAISVADEDDWRRTVGRVLDVADGAIIHVRRLSEGVGWENAEVTRRGLRSLRLVPVHLRTEFLVSGRSTTSTAIYYAHSVDDKWEAGARWLRDRLPILPKNWVDETVLLSIDSPHWEAWASRTQFVELVSIALGLPSRWRTREQFVAQHGA